MLSADQIPVKSAHPMMLWPKWETVVVHLLVIL
jgi:hypothetical protein